MSQKGKIISIIIICVSIVLIAGSSYYWWQSRQIEVLIVTNQINGETEEIKVPQIAMASNFATYKEVPVEIDPQVKNYNVALDFHNVVNFSKFDFNENAKDMLIKNLFVVRPGFNEEFFTIYEANRYDLIPNFITTDSVLHNYHLLFDYLLKKIEKEKLYAALVQLTDAMLLEAENQYEEFQDTDWENATKRNIAFFSVAKNILTPESKINSLVKEEVEKELELIENQAGIRVSNIINIGQSTRAIDAYREDYSQYIPRGHYTKTEELKKYFKAMMWYGRMNFRLKMPDETKSAILMTKALRDKGDAFKDWEIIFEPVNFFVGKTDDLTYYDYDLVYDQIYSKDEILDDENFDQFVAVVKKLDKPAINSMPIFEEEIMSLDSAPSTTLGTSRDRPDREEEIFGWRFMGQRYTIDAETFQHLIDREVKDRFLPKALDIAAVFGSELAENELQDQGEFEYENYEENMSKMQDYVNSLEKDVWQQNLYWAWLYGIKDLLEPVDQGYPSFMTNQAWQYKDLQTFISSWTELKHDTILYAKQVYAEMGGGPTDEDDDRGYVEPRPYVYARIASLLKMTSEGLQVRNLINKEDIELVEDFEDLVLELKNISEKELNGDKLTDKEYDVIRYYGGELEHLWLKVYEDEGVLGRSQLHDFPAALIADVATDPNGEVLEEATGWIDSIYVIFPLDGELRIGKGGVFSHYEFIQPLSGRLTDEEWQEILQFEQEPKRADWHENFLAEF